MWNEARTRILAADDSYFGIPREDVWNEARTNADDSYLRIPYEDVWNEARTVFWLRTTRILEYHEDTSGCDAASAKNMVEILREKFQ